MKTLPLGTCCHLITLSRKHKPYNIAVIRLLLKYEVFWFDGYAPQYTQKQDGSDERD